MYPTDDPYIGGVISDFYVDFDCEENPERARKEAVAVVKALITDYGVPESSICIAFSGMKGFSVTVDYKVFNAESSHYLPLIWKSIVKEFIAKYKLKTVDTRIYERRRLWRLLNSRHQKSGLYKIPLTLAELENLTIEKIKALARKPRELSAAKRNIQPIPKAEKLYLEHKKKIEDWINEHKQKFEKTDLKITIEDPPCVKKRLEIGAKIGTRNIYAFQVAVYYAHKGLSREEILKICNRFMAKSEEPLSEIEVERLVDSAIKGVEAKRYSVGCSSEAFADLCDKANCPFFSQQSNLWSGIGDPISYEEWRQVIENNFPDLWPYAEACASTVAILLIKDALPFALVLQGVPGCGKTTTLSFFYDFPYSHKTDKFTPASFVSHAPQKSEKELEKVDLLPKIRNKVLITPDLSPLFGLPPERLRENLATLTRVLDGCGLVTESGIHGTRGYSGDYMFTWIAATTPIPYAVWDLFGNLGARMYFYQVGTRRKTVDEHLEELRKPSYTQRVKECNEATLRFLKGIWQSGKVEWNPEKDPEEVLRRIVQMALLLVRLRGKVNVVVKEDYEGQKTYYSTPTIEHADRARQALYNLARGHAIIKGRRQLTVDDLPVVIEVTLSSAPYDRVNAFKYLLKKGGTVTTSDLIRDLKCSRRTAIRSMKTLEILGLVDLEKTDIETEVGTRTGYIMRLRDEFRWFTSKEFMKLWRSKNISQLPIELTERTEVVEKLGAFKNWEDIFKGGEDGANGEYRKSRPIQTKEIREN